MALIGWGKPKIEICELDTDGKYPTTPVWEELPTPIEDTTVLNTTKGEKMEAKIEGGENEDVKYKKSTYQLVFDIRAAKGRNKPIVDDDGIINEMYALRLTPEDPTVQGFIADRCKASVEDKYSSKEGGYWSYAFDVLKPDTGKQIKWQVIT